MKRCLPIALLFFALYSYAQSPPLERIGMGQGLSQGFVTCLGQDKEGFIWAGTFNGLNRYDGHRFKLYTHDPFDENSLSGNYVTMLYDQGDFLIIGTHADGLTLLHKKSQQFFRLPYFVEPPTPPATDTQKVVFDKVPHSGINMIDEGGEGDVWLRTHKYLSDATWVCRMVLPDGFWKKIGGPDGREAFKALCLQIKYECWNKPKAYVSQLDDDKTMFYIQSGKVFIWNGQQWEPKPAPPNVNSMFQPKPGQVAGDFWESLDQAKSERVVWQASKDGSGWVEIFRYPLFNGGFFYMDGQLAWWKTNRQIQAVPMRLSPLRIDLASPRWTIDIAEELRPIVLFDHSKNFWFAESVNGLIKFSPLAGRFKHYFAGKSFSGQPMATANGNYFYYRYGDGLVFSKKMGEEENFLRKAFDYKDLYQAFVQADNLGQYWMLSFQNTLDPRAILIRADPRGKTSKRYDLPFIMRRHNQFQLDEDGSVWFVASGQLVRFDPGNETSKTFDFRHLGISDLQCNSIVKTAEGSWWLATDEGLVRAKPVGSGPVGGGVPKSFDFQLLRTNPADRNSPSSNVIASLLTDPKNANILWISTKGGGLNRLDVRSGKFSHITTKHGLPNDVIYGVLPDGEGNLWLSSNRGIVRYNPVTGAIKGFRKADGLQEDEFNTHAFALAPDGKMMFGGINGLTVFDPKDLADNPVKPRVFITGLRVNDKPVSVRDSASVLSESIEFAEHITLPYHQNSLSFEFAALEFTAPSKNRYRYWMKGFEDENRHESYEPSANYIGLPPGDYTFIIYGSNNDGVWGEMPATLHITILPPLYRTWWAYFIYVAIAGSLLYWAHLSRERRRKMKAILEQEQMEAKRLQTQAAHERQLSELRLKEFTQRLLEKSELVEALQSKLHSNGNGNGNGNGHSAENIETIKKLKDLQILTSNGWEEYLELFEQVHPGYYGRLKQQFPQLTNAEVRWVLLQKMEMGRNKIAAMLGISPDSVRKTSKRLQNKLGLPEDQSLEVFFSEL